MILRLITAATMLSGAAASASTLDLNQWQQGGVSEPSARGTWVTSNSEFSTNPADPSETESVGTSVQQTINGRPSVFLNNLPGIASQFSVNAGVRSGAGDDDFFGFVIGFQPGDYSNTAADYLLVDWKRGDQALVVYGQTVAAAPRGLSLSRVRGTPTDPEFWGKTDADPSDAGGVTQLARGAARGNIGWAYNLPYRFDLSYTPDPSDPGKARFAMTVCQGTSCAQEFDVALDQAVYGNIGFYTYSQTGVEFAPVYPPRDPFTLPTYVGQAGTAFAPVPVPASGVLLLAGLGLLGAARRRTR